MRGSSGQGRMGSAGVEFLSDPLALQAEHFCTPPPKAPILRTLGNYVSHHAADWAIIFALSIALCPSV